MSQKNTPTSIDVAAAVIISGDKYLCVQRGKHKYEYLANKWEFPGGKIEIGESPFQALEREIKEELASSIKLLRPLIVNTYSYADFNIRLHSFLCEVENLDFDLTEHIDSKWLPLSKLSNLTWAAADIEIVNYLKKNFPS